MRFPHLFSPFEIRGVALRNRIVSTGHNTRLADNNLPGEALAAYHGARARGGAGLIVTEAAVVHETGRHLSAAADACIPGYRRIADAVHAAGGTVFGQLFHPGRETGPAPDGTLPATYSASSVPNERFHNMPRPMPVPVIDRFVEHYADAAARLCEAGLDGIEVATSQGYGVAQFLCPRTNHRTDDYGGGLENRLRFLRRILAAIRARVGEAPLGIRISADELNDEGLGAEEVLEILRALDGDGMLDYFNLTAGSSATLGAAIHIVPPMAIANAYLAPLAAAARAVVSRPILVTGRINQPQIAEEVLASGQADLVGMTRAMIADPEIARKARDGRLDDIRACVACNQACIGHMQAGYPISCIQYPETGRELAFGAPHPAAARPRKVMVAGGGPGGMKAAAVAAARGHRVTLYERARALGGQVLLAQRLPGREEFGGVVTNLEREMAVAGVEVVRGTAVTPALVEREAPNALILATGARPRLPEIPGADEAHVVTAWQVLRDEVNPGASVVIADWRADWTGLGLAEKLARDGCRVRLCVNGYMAGQSIQQYVRDTWLGILHDLGVEIIPMARLYGADADTAYFQHTTSGKPILCEGTDTLVLALGHTPESGLEADLADWPGELLPIGDCLAPRTVEEATFEGLKAALAV